jgi:ADP-ribose pyrophosphatase YjhB (NUDIX family)
VTFGKGPENVSIALTYADGTLPTKPEEGWDDPTPIEQPAFPELPSGKHISAGIVAVLPATSTSVNSGASVAALAKPTFVMTHPMNEFAGYSITFPKGTVEPGESIEKAAVRECMEETGLTMKLVAFLGDYKGQSSLTRMFMGYVTGGDPKAAGKETDAVSLKPFDFAAPPSKQKWWSQLQKRDQKIVDDAIDWMNVHGLPNEAKVSEAAEDSAVTGPQDTEGEAGPTTYDPKAAYDNKTEFQKQVAGQTDYKVPINTKQWCGSFFSTTYYDAWMYTPQLKFINQGFPPVGALVEVPKSHVPPARVRAYVHTEEEGTEGKFFADYAVVEYEDKANHWAVLVASGQPSAVPSKPGDFHPIVAKESVKPVAVTADTTKDDVWKTLLFKAPFPVSQEMQDALKKKAAAIPSIPVTFSCSKNMTKGPPYGEIVVYPALDADVPYLMAGYVGWKDTEGKDYSFALLVGGGKVQAVPTLNFITDEWSLDVDAKKAASPADPFFTHMDPNINALIQQVYANGGDVKAIGSTVGQFKDQWMKEAKVPAYAVITKPLLQDVASLFVPGAATQAQYDAIIGCLKARMKATHKNKGKKGTSAGTAVATPQITAAAPTLPEVNVPKKVLKAKGLNIESAVYQNYVSTPQPMLFQDLGQTVGGGSKPNKLLAGPGGTKWFFKMGPGQETFRPYVDRAAYLISDLVKGNNIPVGVMEFGGNVGSYQPFSEDATNPPSDPTTLSPENMAEVLSQHMVDMFMGDHDGHVGNWLRIGSQLRAIDRGQAFKFLFQNKNDSYDPTWHAKGNFGEGYAKKLLIEWGNGNVELPKEALQAMRDAIAKVEAIADQQLEGILTPVFDSRDTSPAERKKILKKLYKRRDTYLKDWTTVMKGLKKGFKWPSVGVTIPKVTPLKSSPKTQEFAAREEKTIKEAVAAGWQGKALQIDKDAIENQEVMVRRVTYEEKPGMKIPATLVQFRVSRQAGLKLVQTLAPKAKVTIEEGGTAFGPQRLKADVVKNYYEAILAAIKTVNFHLSKEQNLEINMGTVGNALKLAPELEKIFSQTKDPAGTYKTTGEPNDAVNAMADQYLQYLAAIKVFVDNKEEYLGKHSPKFDPFLWQEPVEEEEPEEIPQIEIELRKQGASLPQSDAQPGEVIISGFNKPVYHASAQPQFVIRDPITQATIFYNPPGGIQGLNSGVEGHKSIAWAVMKGEPSAGVVAHLMKLFEESAGVKMRPATKKDDEILYWSKQAALLQKGGKISPSSDGTIEIEPEYAQAMQQYRIGDDDSALEGLKAFTAKQLGVPVGQLAKQPGYDLKGDYTRGAGWRRHTRIGWTAAKLQSLLGKDATVAHTVTGGAGNMLNFFQMAMKNGALLSNNQKPFYGVSVNGFSTGSDFDAGGTQGLFCVFRKFGSAGENVLYFDIALCLRTDVYVVGSGDAFGNVHTERYTTPEQWKGHIGTGSIGASSHFQINVRHDIDLQTYLLAAVCSSKSARDQVRKLCKDMGWTKFARGRGIEKAIVTGSEASF